MKLKPPAMATAAGLAVLALLAACNGSGSHEGTTSPAVQATIKRDQYGTPHIYADNTYALFYGMGYAVAEDRLFQWEMIKRMARGTLAELNGPAAVEADIAARRAYDPAALQRQIDALASDDRDILSGWADGYNQRLKEVMTDPARLLPKQFTDLGFLPTEISPLDLVAAYFRGSLANFADSNSELINLGLLTELQAKHGTAIGQQIFDQIRWRNDPSSPTTIADQDLPAAHASRAATDASAANRPAQPSSALAQLTPPDPAGLIAAEIASFGGSGPDYYPRASNAWALSADRIMEGQAAFYIGPQYGNANPTNAFGVGLHGAGYNAVGTSHWGFPMVMWGANENIGWGVTVGFGDTVDMFQLKLNPDNTMQYWHNNGWRKLTRRSETIKVKGADSVTVDFYASHYGQIDNMDTDANIAYARGRTWSGQEVDTLIAWSKMNKASNWEQYLEQAEKVAASLNWFYIDAQQNIGMVYVGAFVRKDPAHDFRLPLPGDGSADWLGRLPFSEHPRVFNPASGEILNWNNKVASHWDNADYQYWGHAHRVDIISDVINHKPKLTLDEFRDINSKTSLAEINFRYFKPFLAEAAKRLPANDPRQAAMNQLAAWDGMGLPDASGQYYDTPAYPIFRDWLERMVEHTLKADIPATYWPQYAGASPVSTSIGVNVLLNALLGKQAGVPQTYDFFHGEDKYDVINTVMQQTIDTLGARYGTDIMQWRMPLQPHLFSHIAIGGTQVNTPDQEVSLPVNMNRGTANHMVTFRQGKLDYADVIAPGQSGFIAPDGSASPHYQDQLALYGDFKLKPNGLGETGGIPMPSSKTLSIPR
ncbi:penicillin acylase family protein [Kerstersia gyiorum]|jgi:penicillin amidase|uniref:penicillin acylase family protein n=1 Tax=Kerstersia gyiorum TaxID=206506 RepID=UPI002433229D|nr:penicillin acylase family protein [Kerstersia gyiorum]MCH4271358.1 penicillin acylase family protein [Kerstersia gyiorum]MCI1229640.1 penicillin acylase family protein [Kerstersia gyiorum]